MADRDVQRDQIRRQEFVSVRLAVTAFVLSIITLALLVVCWLALEHHWMRG